MGTIPSLYRYYLKAAVNKLKRKLEEGWAETEKSVVLLKRDRSGNVMPATSSKNSSETFAQVLHYFYNWALVFAPH